MSDEWDINVFDEATNFECRESGGEKKLLVKFDDKETYSFAKIPLDCKVSVAFHGQCWGTCHISRLTT